MIKISAAAAGVFLAASICFNAVGAESRDFALSEEQNKKLSELQKELEAEVEPLWAEIEVKKQQIMQVEKKYFGLFWGMLSEEQKEEFMKLKAKEGKDKAPEEDSNVSLGGERKTETEE